MSHLIPAAMNKIVRELFFNKDFFGLVVWYIN